MGRLNSETWIQDVRRSRINFNKKIIKEDFKKEIKIFKNWDEEVVKFGKKGSENGIKEVLKQILKVFKVVFKKFKKWEDNITKL